MSELESDLAELMEMSGEPEAHDADAAEDPGRDRAVAESATAKPAATKAKANGTAAKAAPKKAAPRVPKAPGDEKPRGPGRPPSKPAPPALQKKGIVDGPNDANNRLEFMFGDPMVFKTLFTFFKNIKTHEIHLRCTPTGLTFFARDHSKKSRVVAHFAGEHVNIHYCDGTFWLGVSPAEVEKIFSSIDKTFYKITIVQSHADTSILKFVFKDGEIDKECVYHVNLPVYPDDPDLYAAEISVTPERVAEMFPIEFTLTAKQFKKSVTDAAAHSDDLAIEKKGEQPLMFTYTKQGMRAHEVYRNGDKIALRSEIGKTGSFLLRIKIAHLKSLVGSMVTDTVRVLCREDDDLLLRSAVDERALVISILTKVSDE